MAAARQRKSKSQNAQPAADPQQAGSGVNEVAATRALSSRASYESSRHETAKDSLPSAAAGSCAAGSGPTADQKVVYITKPTPRKRHWGLRFLALALAFYFGLLAAQRWDLVAKSPLDGAVVSLQSNASEMLQQVGMWPDTSQPEIDELLPFADAGRCIAMQSNHNCRVHHEDFVVLLPRRVFRAPSHQPHCPAPPHPAPAGCYDVSYTGCSDSG